MKKQIRTEIEIDASPARVWRVLTAFASFPRWNPFIKSIYGKLENGATIEVAVMPEGGRMMHFNPKVLVATPERELRWRGKLLFGGLFDGEHYFILDPLGETRTRFIHGEDFSGLLVGLMAKQLDTGTRRGFEAMNAALKTEAEIPEPESWIEHAKAGRIDDAERVIASIEKLDGGDGMVARAELNELLGDMTTDEEVRRYRYTESLRCFQIYASCATSGGEGTARMVDVERVAAKLRDKD